MSSQTGSRKYQESHIMRKFLLVNFSGHFWEPKIVGPFRKGDRFSWWFDQNLNLVGQILVTLRKDMGSCCITGKAKSDYVRSTIRIFLIICSHPLNCIYGSETGLLKFVWGRGGVEMGDWSWLVWSLRLSIFLQKSRSNNFQNWAFFMFSLIHLQKIYLLVDEYTALH